MENIIGNGGFGSYEGKYRALLDLETSDKEVLNIIDQVFSAEDTSVGEQNLVSQLLNRRAQKASLISNAIRVVFDAMSAIIRNIRA